MLKKIIKIFSSRLFYLIIGLSLAIGIFVVQAAWNTRAVPNTPLTSQAWNDIVAKLEELDARGGGASINYSDCVTIDHTEGGVSCSANSWGTCPNNYVMIGATTGLRFPLSCTAAQVRCCRLGSSGGAGGGSGSPCGWNGERAVTGNTGGCNDDLYVTCDGTTVTNLRWGC